MKYVVDTNIFNKLIDGKVSLSELPADAEFVATHVQLDELNATRNLERRANLRAQFLTLSPVIEPTESIVWDVSRWDQGKWSDENCVADAIKRELDGVNGAKGNNWQDALIAEVAVKNGYGLITGDHDLANVVRKLGADVTYVAA